MDRQTSGGHQPTISRDEHARSSMGRTHETDNDQGPSRKRSKRSSGKACIYCRRSHMVCEGGRPCERCIKREISHLCRDVTPPSQRRPSATPPRDASTTNADVKPGDPNLPSSLYTNTNFPPAWPLLTDATAGPVTYNNGHAWDVQEGSTGVWDQTELGALSKFMGDLGVPTGSGDFLDVLSYFSRGGSLNSNNNTVSKPAMPPPAAPPSGNITPGLTPSSGAGPSISSTRRESIVNGDSSDSNGKAKEKQKESSSTLPQLAGVSRIERYFLAAADQPTGPRASRLAQVIKAKYDAGLLKPYNYVRGYERMNKWMDSGRAAPKADSSIGSAPSSPTKAGQSGQSRHVSTTPAPVYNCSISPESRRRILTALNGFRPKFRQIARTLTDVDLVFVEEAMERWMLEYDRAFASIHTPSCIWRRTGEIQKANQEFANLTGIPASMFRGGILCVYELMDEDSAVRYWEGYAKIAFDAGQRSLTSSCTLKIPRSLMRKPPPPRPSATPRGGIPHLMPASLGKSDADRAQVSSNERQAAGPEIVGSVSDAGGSNEEEFRVIKCCFSVTIRRDAWGVPVAIMGQWIPI